MIQAKQELLAGAGGSARADGSGRARCAAAFESPKQAAHGDLAITAAMPLATPLKKNPRELAAALVERCARSRPCSAGCRTLEIAGPGFINLRLKPAAKQAVVAEVLRGGDAFGRQPPRGRARAGRVRLGQPDRPAARGPRAPGGAGRLHLQPVRGAGLAGDARVLLQRRRRADRHAGRVDPGAAAAA